MNATLLQQIAVRSGGKYYTPSTISQLSADLKNNKLFASKEITQASEVELWNLKYILGAILFAFALEWFIRKRSGMV
jgi:hypothetical protein